MSDMQTTYLAAQESEQKKFMARVYGWMGAALTISFVSAVATFYGAYLNPDFARLLFGNPFTMIVLLIVELALVFVLSAKIRTMSMGAAIGAFIAYSIVNGITLSSILLVYTGQSIVAVFLVSALMFGAMSVYGMKTKRNLMSFGRYFTMALFGIIIASVLQLIMSRFMNVGVMDFVIALVTVVVFTGLTAYDTQKMLKASYYANGTEGAKKASILGALELYLDFINIFLSLLRIFGRRRD